MPVGATGKGSTEGRRKGEIALLAFHDNGPWQAAKALWEAQQAGELDGAEIAELIRECVWPRLDPPGGDRGPLSDAQWVTLFRAAAPIQQSGTPVELSFPLRVYRGATTARARGLSWCTSRSMAEAFGKRLSHLGATGHIWTAEIDEHAVLAILNWRTDSVDARDPRAREIVVDPAGLPAQLERL